MSAKLSSLDLDCDEFDWATVTLLSSTKTWFESAAMRERECEGRERKQRRSRTRSEKRAVRIASVEREKVVG